MAIVPLLLEAGRPAKANLSIDAGLLGAIELVRDRGSKEAAPEILGRVISDLLARGVLALPSGIHENVLMLLPPLTIHEAQLRHGLEAIDAAIARVKP